MPQSKYQEGGIQVRTWGKKHSRQRKSKCHGPEAAAGLATRGRESVGWSGADEGQPWQEGRGGLRPWRPRRDCGFLSKSGGFMLNLTGF